jgi:uncharacterized oxidoreductase
MIHVAHEPLQAFVQALFARAGCEIEEAECIARHLVRANLVGHDSHGVIRIPFYLRWLREGKVIANRRPTVGFESESFAVVDAGFGFGQTAGEFAMRLGIEKAQKQGVAVISLRNVGHVGRVGDWPEMTTEAGLVSLHFVSTSGFGLLVAPLGGIDRRLSANPIAIGVPVEGGRPIILDISTCSIAEGKIRVAFNRGETVPDGCILDAEGQPTNDPKVFYANPPGSIVPFGGHKGYGLSIITELLAGAFTGNGCGDPTVDRISNGMLSILMDPGRVPRDMPFGAEVTRFIEFVKSSRLAKPGGAILMPGEVESRMLDQRSREGIPLEEVTRGQLNQCARDLGLEVPPFLSGS